MNISRSWASGLYLVVSSVYIATGERNDERDLSFSSPLSPPVPEMEVPPPLPKWIYMNVTSLAGVGLGEACWKRQVRSCVQVNKDPDTKEVVLESGALVLSSSLTLISLQRSSQRDAFQFGECISQSSNCGSRKKLTRWRLKITCFARIEETLIYDLSTSYIINTKYYHEISKTTT